MRGGGGKHVVELVAVAAVGRDEYTTVTQTCSTLPVR